jgi:hypothetical protein
LEKSFSILRKKWFFDANESNSGSFDYCQMTTVKFMQFNIIQGKIQFWLIFGPFRTFFSVRRLSNTFGNHQEGFIINLKTFYLLVSNILVQKQLLFWEILSCSPKVKLLQIVFLSAFNIYINISSKKYRQRSTDEFNPRWRVTYI